MYWVPYHQERNNEKCPNDGGHKVHSIHRIFRTLCRLFCSWVNSCEPGGLGVLGWKYGLDKLLNLNQH